MTDTKAPLVTALTGLTIACPEIEMLAGLLTGILGWIPVAEGEIGRGEEQAWGISAGGAGAIFRIFRSPGSDRGMIRLVAGIDRLRTRPLATRWAGAELTVANDLDGLYERLSNHPGFRPIHEPMTMDWSEFGSNIHRAFLGRISGGTHLAFTMPVTQPTGRQFPKALAPVGYVFDVPLISPDFARSSRFYRDTLGMIPILTSSFDGGLWHELFNLPDGAKVALDILKGDAAGTGLGGIELQGYDRSLIDPEPAVVDRFDGGAAMLTYTTRDIDAAYKAVSRDPSAKTLSRPAVLHAAPYHGVQSFSFAGPDGERLELCEARWS